MNEIKELNELLERYGTFTRPDASGDRMGLYGVKSKPMSKGSDYPYDVRSFYGEPANYDRGSSGKGPSHSIPIPDDSTWEEGESSVDEVMGSPILLKRAYGAGMGNSTGVPGSISQGWSSNPIKSWDDDETEYGREKTGQTEESAFDVAPIIPSNIGYIDGDWIDMDDEHSGIEKKDVEFDDDVDVEIEITPLTFAGNAFSAGSNGSLKPQRGYNSWQESKAWLDVLIMLEECS